MQNVEQGRRQHRSTWWKGALGILMCVALFSMIAWAQKNNNENQKGVTLADLGVTEAQKTQIEALWELKRQKQIQAVADLKTLNRLVRGFACCRCRDSRKVGCLPHETYGDARTD